MHDPQFADIYRADPTRIMGGDAHPGSTRPCAVVRPQVEFVTVLGRSTTEKHEPPHTLQSAPELSCGLDKQGVFSERHQHVLWRSDFAPTPYHRFLGALPEAPAQELQDFWNQLPV